MNGAGFEFILGFIFITIATLVNSFYEFTGGLFTWVLLLIFIGIFTFAIGLFTYRYYSRIYNITMEELQIIATLSSICPNCKKELPKANSNCPSCGKSL
jgi:hypothetical protein